MGFDLSSYEPVEDRLRAFWTEHPEGRITTEQVNLADDPVIVRAEVFRDEVCPVSATGLARESVDQLPPNMKASALEVCETSAIGRALANLGYAPKGKRPSREEMSAVGGSPLREDGQGSSPASAGTPAADHTSNGGERSTAPETYGEGVTDAGGDSPSFDDLAKLYGGRGKARDALNQAAGTDYPTAVVAERDATDFERKLAHAAYLEAADA